MASRTEEEVIESIKDLQRQLREVLKEKHEMLVKSIPDPKSITKRSIANREKHYQELLKSDKRPRIDFKKEDLLLQMEFNRYTGLYVSKINKKHIIVKYEIRDKSGHTTYCIEILLKNDAIYKVGASYLPEGIEPRETFDKNNALPWMYSIFDQCRYYHYIKNQVDEIKDTVRVIYSLTYRSVCIYMDVVLLNGPQNCRTLKIKLRYDLMSHLPCNYEICCSEMTEEELQIAEEQFSYFSTCEIADAISASLNSPSEDKFVLVSSLDTMDDSSISNQDEELAPAMDSPDRNKHVAEWVRRSAPEGAPEDRVVVDEVEPDRTNQQNEPEEKVSKRQKRGKKQKIEQTNQTKKNPDIKAIPETVEDPNYHQDDVPEEIESKKQKTRAPIKPNMKALKKSKASQNLNTPVAKNKTKAIVTSTPRPELSKIPKPTKKRVPDAPPSAKVPVKKLKGKENR